jgi:Sulfotransferase family
MASVQGMLAAFKARDRDGVAAEVNGLIRTNAPLGDTWGAVSRMAATVGEYNASVEAARRQAALHPQSAPHALQYASMVANAGRIEAALRIGEATLKYAPSDPAVLHFIGTCLSQTGDNKAALEKLHRAGELDPTQAPTWLTIAMLQKFKAGDPLIAKLEMLAPRMPTPEQKSAILYALGKAYDDLGEIDRSFALYTEGAELMRRVRRYDPTPSTNLVRMVEREMDAPFFASLRPSECASDRPIFVHGLPRSGTTLVEHVLCAHSEVSDGAEINLFRLALMALDPTSGQAIRAFESNSAGNVWSKGGASFLHLLDERFGASGRIVDKTLTHSWMFGLIHHVMPNAPLIWMRREPAASALSCFVTRFATGLDWTWSLTDIAQRFREEDVLHRHWSSVLGDKLLTVSYEQLVAAPEVWIPRILQHCSLQDEPGVREFHNSSRPVFTASVAQVREPISTAAVDKWKRYEKHLAPFLDAYYG